MATTLNIKEIQTSWPTCSYRLQVWIDNSTFISWEKHQYILETLTKWFGSAEYMWGNCYLCDKK